MTEKYIQCAICGATVRKKTGNQKLCAAPECQAAYAKQRRRARSKIYNRYIYAERRKPELEPKRRTATRRNASKELFNLDGKSISAVALEAKALGMSYGKYCEACFTGAIEQKLAMVGISRERAQSMIAAEYRRAADVKKKKARAF